MAADLVVHLQPGQPIVGESTAQAALAQLLDQPVLHPLVEIVPVHGAAIAAEEGEVDGLLTGPPVPAA